MKNNNFIETYMVQLNSVVERGVFGLTLNMFTLLVKVYHETFIVFFILTRNHVKYYNVHHYFISVF